MDVTPDGTVKLVVVPTANTCWPIGGEACAWAGRTTLSTTGLVHLSGSAAPARTAPPPTASDLRTFRLAISLRS